MNFSRANRIQVSQTLLAVYVLNILRANIYLQISSVKPASLQQNTFKIHGIIGKVETVCLSLN